MIITKEQLRRMIKEVLSPEEADLRAQFELPGAHRIDTIAREMDHHHGRSDVYTALIRPLFDLRDKGDEDAEYAIEEFEMAENYGTDDTENLLSLLDQFPGLKDRLNPYFRD